jgi:hypothetical protein
MVDAELIISLYDYLKDFVNSESVLYKNNCGSPLKFLKAQEALIWLQKCPSSVQEMNVSSCLSLDGRPDFKLLHQQLLTIPVDRYTALLKTNIELLSLLK